MQLQAIDAETSPHPSRDHPRRGHELTDNTAPNWWTWPQPSRHASQASTAKHLYLAGTDGTPAEKPLGSFSWAAARASSSQRMPSRGLHGTGMRWMRGAAGTAMAPALIRSLHRAWVQALITGYVATLLLRSLGAVLAGYPSW